MLSRLRLSRRRWNTVLIFAVMGFILVMSAPSLIKQYLLPEEQAASSFILDPKLRVTQLHLPKVSLTLSSTQWRSNKALELVGEELVARWVSLKGTSVSNELFSRLKPTLPAPVTIEVWYQATEEPQRITAYQTNDFWLFSSYEKQWVAVSFESNYLFPNPN
ncbi:hypothetical protein LNL84_14840 [Vibrio sp. ZSDZ34]|uniref:Uncharacterized protein n=1 Tax=Vibrio gelatinilyticus TaxID=2893468 RepID=A0A9X2AZZ2_9VIBR|nr:hypothetical protein [Vibrio gelatinilyticus]MCJ2378103.1 hypothetical protein [Vibrio gelatinilyticus]